MKHLIKLIREAERRAELFSWLEIQIRNFSVAHNLWSFLERAEKEGASFMAWWKQSWLKGTIDDDLWADPTGWTLIVELPASAKKWVRPMLPDLDFRKMFSVTQHKDSPLLVESWKWRSDEPDYKDRREVEIRFMRPTFEGERIGECRVTLEMRREERFREDWSVSCEAGQSKG